MKAINFNMDIGDAWKHVKWPAHTESITALAYVYLVIYVTYVMAH